MNALNLYNGSGFRVQGEAAHSENLNDLKLLSVIIPAYNTAKFLNKCVESVVNQTYQNIEIIIVDDGSQDNTPQLCDELANKYNNIKVIHQENKGLAQTRSVGFNASRGEYIAFVDSDDYIDLNAYAKAIKVLEDNDADMVMFGVKLVDLEEKILAVWAWDNKIFSTPRDVFKFFAETDKPNWGMPYKIYKRSLFENISWPKISMAEDYCISAQLFARTNKLAVISDPFYYYVSQPDSLVHKPYTDKTKLDEMIWAYDFVLKITEQNFPEFMPEFLWRNIDTSHMILAKCITEENSSTYEIFNQLMPSLKLNYKRMKQELKAQGRDLYINKKLIRKTKIHLSLLIHCPKLYKLYLTTRLAINKLTGI